MFVTMTNLCGINVPVWQHDSTDNDEVTAYWLLLDYCTPAFLRQFYFSRGEISLGCRGGPFDEHPRNKGERRKKGCCASLVAEALGIRHDPHVSHIVDYALACDAGKKNGDDLASGIAALHLQFPGRPEVALKWALVGLREKSRYPGPGFAMTDIVELILPHDPTEALQWFARGMKARGVEQGLVNLARANLPTIARVLMVPGPGGKNLRLAVVCSDNPKAAGVAGRELEADIVVQRWPSGNTQIMSWCWRLEETPAAIRRAELLAAGRSSVDDLAGEGMFDDECWYVYFVEDADLFGIFNGSLKYMDVSPTRLTLDEILAIIRRTTAQARHR